MAQQLVQKTIPATGESIPALGLGTWQTFDAGSAATERESLKQVLKLFVQEGGRLIDSSPMYGRAEQVVGELAVELGLQNSLFMATKVWTSGEEKGRQQITNSLDLLRKPTLDLMQVHNLVDYKTHLKTLKGWKDEGKIRYIGITHYVTSAYPELMRVMREYAVDFVQFNYSLQTREAEKAILPFAADQGVAVIINRPFEEGSIFARVAGKPLPDWAGQIECTSWSQFFLKYILSHPAVSCVIPATAKPDHLSDNMKAAMGPLPEEVVRKEMAQYFDRIA